MTLMKLSLSAVLVALALASPVAAQRRGDQYQAFQDRSKGQALSLREIEDRVLPRMRGASYLGPEYSGGVYRLKFMRGSAVIWVDVDARSGAVIGQSGS